MARKEDEVSPEEVRLLDLYRTFALGWRAFVVCLCIGLIAGVVYDIASVHKYTATVHIAPVSPRNNSLGRISDALGGLSALASLSGMNVGSNDTATPFEQFEVLLKSEPFADSLENKYGFLKRIYAARWDEANKRWIDRPGLLQGLRNLVTGASASSVPDGHELASYIAENVDLRKVESAPIYEVTYADKDPEFAQTFLRAVVLQLNEMIRLRLLGNTDRSIAYLQDRIDHTNAADLRASLVSLLITQEQTRMMLNAGQPSAAEILDDVSTTKVPNVPSLLQLFGLPLALFALLGIALAYFEGRLRQRGELQTVVTGLRRGKDMNAMGVSRQEAR
jgi:hypothetical protein